MKAKAWVAVSNVGTPEGGPLRVLGGRLSDASHYTVLAPTVTNLRPGDPPALFEVEFFPRAEGQFATVLVIESNDGNTPEYTVPIRGEAMELPPCTWAAEPALVDFGTVQTGSVSTLALRLRNTGENECIFSSVALAPSGSTGFRLVGAPIGLASVAPGGSVSAAVAFEARTVGNHVGAIQFYVNDPNGSQASIPLKASVFTGCLTANPAAIDFGKQRLSCPPANRSVQITNTCATPSKSERRIWAAARCRRES